MSETTPWDQVAETVEFTLPLDMSYLKSRIPSGSRILDLGCGYGRIASQLYQAGFDIVGYDSSSKLIHRGRASFPHLDLRVGNARSIPEPSGSFQAVIVSALFTTVPKPQTRSEIVREIRRILSPGGFVFGADFLRQESTTYVKGGLFTSTAGIDMKHFQIQELEELFSDFIDWQYCKTSTSSLSGKPVEALQYSVKLPPDNLM